MDNYTKFPNEILEALMRYRLPGRRHLVVMLYIARMTYGWHKEAGDHISVKKMAEEIGIRRPTLSGIVNDLAKMGLIEMERSNGHASFMRILPPDKWEETVSYTGLSRTGDMSRTRDTYMSRTGDRGVSSTRDMGVSRTGDTPKKIKESNKDSIKESVSSLLEDGEEVTPEEMASRWRRTYGETDL